MTYNPNFTGSSLQLPSKSVGDTALNDTGAVLTKITPIRINASGDIDSVDVSAEIQSLASVGVVTEDIPDGEIGNITTNGRVEDITTTATFGDVLYISKTGDLTNVKPSLGVGGFAEEDFVIFIGTVRKNQDNALLKDLLVNVTIIGQL